MDSSSSLTPFIPNPILNLDGKLKELKTLTKHSEKNKEIIKEKMEEILEIVVCHGSMWKDFKKWAKYRNISTKNFKRSDIAKIAEAVQKAGVLNKMHINSLNETLLSSAKMNSGKLTTMVPSTLLQTTSESPVLHELETSFLDQAVHKNYKKFKKMIAIIKAYQSEMMTGVVGEDYINTLQVNLQVWILQYLAKSSKIPLLEQRGPIHIPFLEYYFRNTQEYYRHDAGAITLLLLTFLKEKHGLRNDESYALDVIKMGCFEPICNAACKTLNLTYVPINSNQFHEFEDNTFYDITLLMQETFLSESGKGINALIDTFSKMVKESGKSIIFGGVITIDGQECFLLLPRPQLDPLMIQMIEFRGSVGAVPEISQIRRQLIEAEFPLETLLKYSPVELPTLPQTDIVSVSGTLKEVLEALDKVITNIPKEAYTSIAAFYFEMFTDLLTTIQQCIIKDPNLTECSQLGPLKDAIQTIGKKMAKIEQIDSIRQMDPGRKLQEILQDVYLAAEELSLILCFVDLNSGLEQSSPLKETIQAIEIQKTFKQTLICTSGISAMRHVLEGLNEVNKNLNAARFIIAFLTGSYYEYESEKELGGYLQQFSRPLSASLEMMLNKRLPCNVICLDIYPNYVPLSIVRATPLIQIAEKQLEDRTKEEPLTFVIDASTSMFWDKKIEELVNKFSNEILEEILNVVVVNSLAKFAMCGFDKYTGGVLQTYNQFTSDSPFAAFNRYLIEATEKDFPSPEAEKFFYLFMQNDGYLIKKYLEKINKNTEVMYGLLASLQQGTNSIQLGERDKNIPMIGLSFSNLFSTIFGKLAEEGSPEPLHNLTFFMQYFLAAKALKLDILVSLRISFGFPSINFTECATALRMTIGLEDRIIIKAFAKMLLFENKALEETHQLKKKSLKKIKFVLEKGNSSLKNWIETNKLKLVDFAKGHSFVEVLEFIYDEVDPEKMLRDILNELENRPYSKWFEKNETQLLAFAKNHSKEELQQFIKDKFIPLYLICRDLQKSKNGSFNEWINNRTDLLLDFVTSHSIEELQQFIKDKFIPLYSICRDLQKSKNGSFNEWIDNNTPLLVEFINDYPLEEVKNFAIKAFYVYKFALTLSNWDFNNEISGLQEWLRNFQLMAIDFAKTHSFEEVQLFVYKMADLNVLFLLIAPTINSEDLEKFTDFKEEATEFVLDHSYEELVEYLKGKNLDLKVTVRKDLPDGLPRFNH